MLFQASITIPKNTTKANPTIVMMPIAKGIITKFMVRPRAGHASVAHLIIRHHETQIAPSMENTDLHGDIHPIDWEDYYKSYQPAFELKLIGWNDSVSYPHTFDVFVAVLPREAIVSLAIVDAIVKVFEDFGNYLSTLSPKRIFSKR